MPAHITDTYIQPVTRGILALKTMDTSGKYKHICMKHDKGKMDFVKQTVHLNCISGTLYTTLTTSKLNIRATL
jgi:hypothetical protein